MTYCTVLVFQLFISRLPSPSQATTGWAQTVVNGSAVALLAFLFLLNLTQVLHTALWGGGGRAVWVSGLTYILSSPVLTKHSPTFQGSRTSAEARGRTGRPLCPGDHC